MSVRVLIADDQALVRAGFRKQLETAPDIEVIGEVADGREAVDQARRLRPSLVLMDIRMPRLDGIEATRRLTADGDGPRVLILTTFGLDEYVFKALRAGASGFMLKDAPPEELLAAVDTIARGDTLLAPAVTRSVIEEFVRRSPAPAPPPPALEELTNASVRYSSCSRRPVQLRDRRPARRQQRHRQDPCRAHPAEALAARSGPSGHHRLRARSRDARCKKVLAPGCWCGG